MLRLSAANRHWKKNRFMSKARLPFWQFFHSIEKELSYERWISKYKILLEAFEQEYFEYDDEWEGFKKFCRTLYLQNYADLNRFNELLDNAIEQEKTFMMDYVTETKKPKANGDDEKKTSVRNEETDNSISQDHTKKNNSNPVEMSRNQKGEYMDEPVDATTAREYFYQPPQLIIEDDVEPNSGLKHKQGAGHVDTSFLMTDEYFSVNRRQMIKGWQFLRHQEATGFTNEIDVTETVKKIARDGLFTTPSYNRGLRNREDTLIIFADSRGSMMPFHELTERLIATARSEGGHPRAPVFYYQNYPTGYVYSRPNFSDPIKVKEALVKANRNLTIAVIISDGGAARGNTDPIRKEKRSEMTEVFLKMLRDTCAHVVWLNPMPENRWKNTSAELISKQVYKMKAIMDNDGSNFQEMLRTILRHIKE